MKSVFTLFVLPILFLLEAEAAIAPSGWKLVSQFEQGDLFVSLTNKRMTLTSFHKDDNTFTSHRAFKSEMYFKGLTELRKHSFGIGGLKDWKLDKIIGEEKHKSALVLTFLGHYKRANNTVVKMYERHIFDRNHFWQWQIVTDINQAISDEAKILATFEEVSRGIIP